MAKQQDERIGEVQLSSGFIVAVGVVPNSGAVDVTMLTNDRRYRDRSGLDVPVVDANAVAQLLLRAATLAPVIKAAYDTKTRAVQTAEATYERIVANAIGRAK